MRPEPKNPRTEEEGTEASVPQEAKAAEARRFDFCPHKDLNLPTSYEEVLKRFRRLQGDRAWEVMN
ncbi:MAG: hypothetical protein IT228_07005 [Flavobacteriales bacterium]|nr:hypothetical protein [Flavobacteriales bacterium]NUQ15421.1 hypothetical protein [Flavobacteriales bacterium]